MAGQKSLDVRRKVEPLASVGGGPPDRDPAMMVASKERKTPISRKEREESAFGSRRKPQQTSPGKRRGKKKGDEGRALRDTGQKGGCRRLTKGGRNHFVETGDERGGFLVQREKGRRNGRN